MLFPCYSQEHFGYFCISYCMYLQWLKAYEYFQSTEIVVLRCQKSDNWRKRSDLSSSSAFPNINKKLFYYYYHYYQNQNWKLKDANSSFFFFLQREGVRIWSKKRIMFEWLGNVGENTYQTRDIKLWRVCVCLQCSANVWRWDGRKIDLQSSQDVERTFTVNFFSPSSL